MTVARFPERQNTPGGHFAREERFIDSILGQYYHDYDNNDNISFKPIYDYGLPNKEAPPLLFPPNIPEKVFNSSRPSANTGRI